MPSPPLELLLILQTCLFFLAVKVVAIDFTLLFITFYQHNELKCFLFMAFFLLPIHISVLNNHKQTLLRFKPITALIKEDRGHRYVSTISDKHIKQDEKETDLTISASQNC